MAAYRADIEIAVKGGRQLAEVSERIGELNKQINNVNKAAKLQGAIPASVNNYRSAVEQANAAVRASAAGTTTQKRAIDLYVKSLAQAEKAELNLANAIKKRQRELNLGTAATGSRGGQGRFAGVASNAIIGGAFPLLFGQGAGAATGGAIGGALGGLFGGTGGFAGSLLGTLIGDLASQANQVKSLGTDIGFSAQQTQQLADAFKQAGTDFDKFQDSVQNIRGLGLSIEEQADTIRLVSALTDTYGGKIDKVTNAFTSALESGKVTQATLNQLTSQGIPIQDELAKKYGISRDSLLQMTKDGEVSVQSLADTLVDMGNKALEAGEKPRTAFDNFTLALGNTGIAIGNVANTLLTVLSPAIDTIILQATQALNILTETINTELLRTKIQKQSGKILSPAKLREIEDTATSMAATRYPSEAKGRQLVAGPKILSPRAQAEFQVLREQMIRNELKSFGYESGILTPPKPTTTTEIGKITAPSQLPPSGAKRDSDKAARDAARLAEEIAKQKAAAREALAVEKGRLLVAETANPIQQKITAAIVKQNDIQREYAAKIKESKSAEATLNFQLAERNALQTNALELQSALGAETDKLTQPLADLLQTSKDRLEFENKYQEILAQGINPELAKIYAQLELSAEKQAELLALRLAELEAAKAKLAPESAVAKALQEQIDKIKEIQRLRGQQVDQGKKAATEEERKRTEREKQLQKAKDQAELVEQQIAAIGATIGDQLMGVFDNLINKTRDWNDVLRDALMGIGKVLMMAGLNALAGFGDPTGQGTGVLSFLGFGSGFGKRAVGGPVTGSTPYVVGERGPELFVPGTGGTVVNNNDLRSAMGTAPGARNGPMLNMTFQTTNIGGVEYVSRDQLEAAMAATRKAAANDGARQGTAATLSKLQQSPSTRAKLGLR